MDNPSELDVVKVIAWVHQASAFLSVRQNSNLQA